MRFQTLDEIRAHTWFGNHASDSAAMAAVNRWVIEPGRTPQDAYEAFKAISEEAMGEPMEPYDEAAILAEMQETRESEAHAEDKGWRR